MNERVGRRAFVRGAAAATTVVAAEGFFNLNRYKLRAAYKSSYGFRAKLDIDEVAHPGRMHDLVEGLIRRKYSDAEIVGIIGGNFKRVLSEIWTVG